MGFWFNINTGQVETDDNKGPSENLMGPYESEADARNAIATAAEKTEQWDDEDRAWEGDTEPEE
ncbi:MULTISPECIES: methionine aminopeptidase [unclassified Janibacter]|uniref:methionine aminopeptidase n=1 Tax=unclassified Janibacter TaxID=2649294 RepID=UPI003D04BF1E